MGGLLGDIMPTTWLRSLRNLWQYDALITAQFLVMASMLPLSLLGKAGLVGPLLLYQVLLIINVIRYKAWRMVHYKHPILIILLASFMVMLGGTLYYSANIEHSLLIWARSVAIIFMVLYSIYLLPHIERHIIIDYLKMLYPLMVALACVMLCYVTIQAFFIMATDIKELKVNKAPASLVVFIMLLAIYARHRVMVPMTAYYIAMVLSLLLLWNFFYVINLSEATLGGLFVVCIMAAFLHLGHYITASIRYILYIIMLLAVMMVLYYIYSKLTLIDGNYIINSLCRNGDAYNYHCIVSHVKQNFLPIIDGHRQIIWNHILLLINNNIWFGVGIDMIPHAQPLYAVDSYFILTTHPHNWMLEIIADTGIISFSLLILSLIYALIYMIEHYYKTGMPHYKYMALLLMYYTVSSMANYSVWSYWWLGAFSTSMIWLAIGRYSEEA